MALVRSRFRWVTLVALVAGCSGGGGGGDNPPPATRTLTVSASGTGTGTVTSSPSGIACTTGSASGCSASFAQDTHVTLTAAAANGSTFAGWSGGGCGGAGTCTVILGSDTAVTATFVAAGPPVYHTLTVIVAGGGTGSVTSSPDVVTCASGTCNVDLLEGTTVALTATPTGGATFAGWSGACSGAGTCSVTLSASKSVTATFVPPPAPSRTLALFPSGSGTGHVTSSAGGIDCPGACSAQYADGTTVTLTATPTVAGSRFSRWEGACTGTASTCTLTLTSDASVTFVFAQQHQLTIAMQQDGAGTVTSAPAGIDCTSGSTSGCSLWLDEGASIVLTATTAPGTTFLGWGDPCWGTTAPCTVTMQSNDWTLTADFSAWIVHRPFPTDLYGAAKLGTTLLAVGNLGAWVTSTDGVAWTGHERPGTPTLRGVAAGGGTAVAVGDGGTILTTTDGASWAARASGTGAQLSGVAFGAGTFVAVGAAGTLLSSSDGAIWSAATSGTARDLLAVAYGNGTFVAVGYAGTVLTSADGQAWTSPSSATVARLNGVAYGSSGFVAVGDSGAVVTSTNGSSWTVQAAPTTARLLGVAALVASYVATDDQKKAWVSANGTSWTWHGADAGQGVATPVALGADAYLLGVGLGGMSGDQGGGIARSGDGGASWALALSPGSQLYEGAWGAGRYVLVGYHGAIYSSPDGATWTSRRAAKDELVTSVAFGNGTFVAVSSAGMLASADGETWTSVGTAVGPYGGVVRYASGLGFVAMGTNNTDSFVQTSANGSAWTARATVTGALLRSLAYGASTFVAAGDGGTIYSNPDPSNGGQWILETQLVNALGSLAYGNGTFAGVFGGASSASYTSSSGVGASWTEHPSATWLYPILTFGNGVFRSAMATSTDGATWTPATRPTVPGEDPGFVTPLAVAVYGGPAPWVVAKGLSVMSGGGLAFATHP